MKAKDTVLEYDAVDTGANWITIAYVESIKPPTISADEIDDTTLTNAAKHKLSGLIDYGDMEATIHYDATQTATLVGLLGVDDTNFRIRYVDDSGWLMQGFLKELGDDEVKNGDLVRTTVKITCNSITHEDDFGVA